MRLTVGERVGEFPGMVRERELVLVVHAGADTTLRGNDSGQPVATARLRYVGQAVSVQW